MILGETVKDINSWRLQRAYLWDFILPDSIGGYNATDVAKYCQDIDFGDYNMTAISSMRYGAYQLGFAGKFDINTFTAVFLRPIPDIVSAYFYAWKEKIITPAGFYNVKSEYAREASVVLYDTTGNQSGRIKLVGVFPKTFPAYQLSYESERFVTFRLEFNVDKVYVNL